ncbi:MAG: alpha/beta fold hydrolase [Chloroflexota bacterium]
MANVLLVPGIFDTSRSLAGLAAMLNGAGWSTHALDLKPNDGTAPLDQLAQQIVAYETQHLPQDRPFILIGFSMGAMVSRFYLQRLGGLARVRQFISISAPHHGTLWAYGLNRAAARQLRPGSEFLAELNGDAGQLRQANHVSIWTPFDLTIVPAASSRIAHGRNILLPVVAHPLMLFDPYCFREVKNICAAAGGPQEA